jgi:hypothetical protein
MSTKKTDSTTTTESKTSDNKKIFGPLGKYAVVAMIMASIIVTTAIMLNKQLNTVDEQLAAIESEVTDINSASSAITVTAGVSETASKTQDTAEAVEIKAAPVELQANEAASAEVLSTTAIAAKETVSESLISTEQVSSTDAAIIESTKNKNSAADNQIQLAGTKRDQQRQARIESFKLEHKQHMAEMFARIKSLESEQLHQYKIHQDKQVERLRQQIAKQEQLIETLILRNKEQIDIRAASMQRSQSNRERMLNRI